MSFVDMWEAASERFQEQTGQKLERNPGMSLDDCLRRIEAARPSESAERPPFALKKCVVAEGAEMVHAPSKICFSAFAMLLDIPEKVEDFWDRVNGLLDALWPSLSDFEIYGDMSQFDQLDHRLKRAINMLMICFVDNCALSVSLRSMRTWQRFKVTAKQLAFEESDLDSAIMRFQELSQVSRFNKSYVGFENRIGKQGAGEKSDDIGKALSTQRIPRTADWYDNHNNYPEYAKWADVKNPDASQILLVIGEQNTGKSTLLASIARSLGAADSSNPSSRTGVSAIFSKNSSGKDGEEKRPIETAIKCIAYMIAEQDEQYAKEPSKSLDKSDAEKKLNNATARELWYILEIASPRKKYTHFIITDGIEGLSKPFQKSREDFFEILASSSSNDRTRQSQIGPRIAVSARSEPTAISFRDLALAKFDVQDHTVADMERFIESDLKDNEIFQELDEDSVKMHGMIRDKLANKEQLSAAEVRKLNELLMWVIYVHSYFDVQALEAALFLGGKKKSMLRLSKKLKGKYAPLIKLDDGFAKMDENMVKAVLKPKTAPGRKDDPQMLSATITKSKGELHRVHNFLWTLSEKIRQESLIFQQLGEQTDIKGAIKANFLESKPVRAEFLAKLQGNRQPSAYLQIMMALRTLGEIQPKLKKVQTKAPIAITVGYERHC
ncbi:hypothetical protein CaCOL14_004510 [Colletotrichum acutatum]